MAEVKIPLQVHLHHSKKRTGAILEIRLGDDMIYSKTEEIRYGNRHEFHMSNLQQLRPLYEALSKVFQPAAESPPAGNDLGVSATPGDLVGGEVSS